MEIELTFVQPSTNNELVQQQKACKQDKDEIAEYHPTFHSRKNEISCISVEVLKRRKKNEEENI